MPKRGSSRERFRPEHHRDPWAAGQVRQQIGVPFPWQAGASERQLVHWRRCHRRDDARLRIFHRLAERVVRRLAGFSLQFSWNEPRTCRRAIHDRFTCVADAWIVSREGIDRFLAALNGHAPAKVAASPGRRGRRPQAVANG